MIGRLRRESIASFIQSGSELLKGRMESFDEKIRECEREIDEEVTEQRLTEEQKEKLFSKYCRLFDIYFEEGIKVGVMLLMELIK